ncbi:hypothetical protein PVAP13_4KG248286 [Panicum virgatum]|uniref:Uncharacterized protein n=1 Tax=Panicum virgatum TaxID=38727 RepID=A0A8T0TN11_PANVG|nr:hypothetical protein PVAP13_4KG248286 [Panicum virgatum]
MSIPRRAGDPLPPNPNLAGRGRAGAGGEGASRLPRSRGPRVPPSLALATETGSQGARNGGLEGPGGDGAEQLATCARVLRILEMGGAINAGDLHEAPSTRASRPPRAPPQGQPRLRPRRRAPGPRGRAAVAALGTPQRRDLPARPPRAAGSALRHHAPPRRAASLEASNYALASNSRSFCSSL